MGWLYWLLDIFRRRGPPLPQRLCLYSWTSRRGYLREDDFVQWQEGNASVKTQDATYQFDEKVRDVCWPYILLDNSAIYQVGHGWVYHPAKLQGDWSTVPLVGLYEVEGEVHVLTQTGLVCQLWRPNQLKILHDLGGEVRGFQLTLNRLAVWTVQEAGKPLLDLLDISGFQLLFRYAHFQKGDRLTKLALRPDEDQLIVGVNSDFWVFQVGNPNYYRLKEAELTNGEELGIHLEGLEFLALGDLYFVYGLPNGRVSVTALPLAGLLKVAHHYVPPGQGPWRGFLEEKQMVCLKPRTHWRPVPLTIPKPQSLVFSEVFAYQSGDAWHQICLTYVWEILEDKAASNLGEALEMCRSKMRGCQEVGNAAVLQKFWVDLFAYQLSTNAQSLLTRVKSLMATKMSFEDFRHSDYLGKLRVLSKCSEAQMKDLLAGLQMGNQQKILAYRRKYEIDFCLPKVPADLMEFLLSTQHSGLFYVDSDLLATQLETYLMSELRLVNHSWPHLQGLVRQLPNPPVALIDQMRGLSLIAHEHLGFDRLTLNGTRPEQLLACVENLSFSTVPDIWEAFYPDVSFLPIVQHYLGIGKFGLSTQKEMVRFFLSRQIFEELLNYHRESSESKATAIFRQAVQEIEHSWAAEAQLSASGFFEWAAPPKEDISALLHGLEESPPQRELRAPWGVLHYLCGLEHRPRPTQNTPAVPRESDLLGLLSSWKDKLESTLDLLENFEAPVDGPTECRAECLETGEWIDLVENLADVDVFLLPILQAEARITSMHTGLTLCRLALELYGNFPELSGVLNLFEQLEDLLLMAMEDGAQKLNLKEFIFRPPPKLSPHVNSIRQLLAQQVGRDPFPEADPMPEVIPPSPPEPEAPGMADEVSPLIREFLHNSWQPQQVSHWSSQKFEEFLKLDEDSILQTFILKSF